MNRSLGLQLAVYGLLLAGLAALVYFLSPGATQSTLITGTVGGIACVVWGIRAMKGESGRALTMLTLVIVNYFLLSQTVMRWGAAPNSLPGRQTTAILTTVLFGLSFVMLFRIAHAGQFEGQPGIPSKSDTPAVGSTQEKPAGKTYLSGREARRSN